METQNKANTLSLTNYLLKPIDASTLGLYRILFGFLMVIEVIRYFALGSIHKYYIKPQYWFSFEWTSFLTPLSEKGMYFLFGFLGLCALGITLGLFFRFSCFGFWVAYTYVFLLDKAEYNNHYYLISLLAFLFFISNANRWASLDKKWKPKKIGESWLPFWQLFLFRAQFFVVYFYGGIAKINQDWLAGEPIRQWLYYLTDTPFIGWFLETEFATYFLCYVGLFLDLFIGFLLVWKSTRLFALFLLLVFHLSNSMLFSIGIFPWLGLCSVIVFFPADWARHFLVRITRTQFYRFLIHVLLAIPAIVFSFGPRWLSKKISLLQQFFLDLSQKEFPPSIIPKTSPHSKKILFVVFLYLFFQVALPLRHWLYPMHPSWTEQGHRFSWRMKLRDKQPGLFFLQWWKTEGNTFSWKVEIRDKGAFETFEIRGKKNPKKEINKLDRLTPMRLQKRLEELWEKYGEGDVPYPQASHLIVFIVTDPKTKRSWRPYLMKELSWRQITKMASSPDMILQYAHHLKKKFEKKLNLDNLEVRVNNWCALNGRPYQRMVDPKVNLGEITDSAFVHSYWILPVEEENNPPGGPLDAILIALCFVGAIGLLLRLMKEHHVTF